MLYNKRWVGTDSTSSLTFFFNVNLALQLSFYVSGLSPTQPCSCQAPSLPASPPPLPTPPLPLLGGGPLGPSQHAQPPALMETRSTPANPGCGVPKESFPSLVAGSAARCSNRRGNREQQLPVIPASPDPHHPCIASQKAPCLRRARASPA